MKNWWTVEPDKFALLDRHHTKGRGGAAIQYVTRHHIMGALTTEQTRNVWLTRQASAHYVVENSGQIGQIIYDRDTAWSNGNAASNRVSVSIEHANSGGGPDWPISPTVIREGARLAAALCWFYKLGRPVFGRNIRDHQEFTATACPQHLRNGGRYHSEWMRIAQEHYDYMAANPNGAPAPTPSPEEDDMAADLNTRIKVASGEEHRAQDLIKWTDERVYELTREGGRLDRLEAKIDKLLEGK